MTNSQFLFPPLLVQFAKACQNRLQSGPAARILNSGAGAAKTAILRAIPAKNAAAGP